MPRADLYLDQIDLGKYFSEKECKKCGLHSCKELVEKLHSGEFSFSDLKWFSRPRANALQVALQAKKVLPAVPAIQLPQPGPTGLVQLNHPNPSDPVLVTSNSELTQQVLLAVLSTTTSPFFVLFVDTNGDTLDMAIILKTFTPQRIQQAIAESELETKAPASFMLIPGLAASMQAPIQSVTQLPVRVGPVCIAELPLFMGDKWEGSSA